MGAVVAASGVTFRVWAPHASKVFVTGSFNSWAEAPLHPEENGYWSADVPTATVGDEYRYLLHGPRGVQSRIDPYVSNGLQC
jgi:1,4-alpha-glucan branching enzyme